MTADEIINWLEHTGTPEQVADMARYGIPNDRAFGVPMGVMKKHAKQLGKDHAVARALWADGRYEARTMAVFIAEADRMPSEEADQWAADFDNWAICDTACFSLLDQTPYRWDKVHLWAPDEREFMRRAGFAMIWALSVHDTATADQVFIDTFPLMREAATDPRPLVKKAVDMALRATGKRNAALNRATRDFAQDLVGHDDKTAGWIGRHALKELESHKVLAKLG